MEFEFDPVKSEANKAKHGIDFVAAQELWYDLYAVVRMLVPAERGESGLGRIAVFYGQVYVLRIGAFGSSRCAEQEFRKGVAMKTISAEEFDRKFDDGEDISEYVDWSKATCPISSLLNLPSPSGAARSFGLSVRRKSSVCPWIPYSKIGCAKNWMLRGHPPPNNTLARFNSSRYSSSHEDKRHDHCCD